MIDIKQNLLQIRNEITQISLKSVRSADEVTLVAVSKTKPLELIAEAYQCGQRHFAENYVQEGVEKIHNWATSQNASMDPIIWHFIGSIQSNKCASIAQNFDWIHSLASVKHARRLNSYRQELQTPLNVCIQVQIKNESQRSGLALDEVTEFLPQIADFPLLNVRGLMCVLPVGWQGEQANYGFDLVHKKFIELKAKHTNLDTLSLGMSGDYRNALSHGSTMLRLGSAVFGKRK